MSTSRLAERIRRRETPLFDALYRTAKWIRGRSMPPIRLIYLPLRGERALRHGLWAGVSRFLYHEPMFRTRCLSCGPGLHLVGGQPQLLGPLVLRIGRGVTMHGVSTFAAGKLVPEPLLEVGDHTHLGYRLDLSVSDQVRIGRHVLIANRVCLMGYDFHPLDAMSRARNEPPGPEGIGSIHIGDHVWIGSDVTVLKGVTIGEGAVIGVGAMVTRDIPPFSLAVGNPARVVRSLAPVAGPRSGAA